LISKNQSGNFLGTASDRRTDLKPVLQASAPILNARQSPKTVRAPRLGIGLSVTGRLAKARLLGADTAAPHRLGGPGALMRKLVQELGNLLARDHL